MLQQGIEIYFEQAMDISKRLQKIAGNINYMAEETGMRSMKVITEVWVGEKADLYMEKYADTNMRVKENAADLQRIGSGIEQRLTNIFSSENKNVVTAILRKY